jgi:hypothetical protein
MKTESDVFNSQAMDHVKQVKAMEKDYARKDPNLLKNEKGYHLLVWSSREHGMATYDIQNLHGQLLAEHIWPAMASSLPSSPGGNNATGDVDPESRTGAKHAGSQPTSSAIVVEVTSITRMNALATPAKPSVDASHQAVVVVGDEADHVVEDVHKVLRVVGVVVPDHKCPGGMSSPPTR